MPPPSSHITLLGIVWFLFLVFEVWLHIGTKRTLLLTCLLPAGIWIVLNLKAWIIPICVVLLWIV
jgi:hypothetical protein